MAGFIGIYYVDLTKPGYKTNKAALRINAIREMANYF